MSNSAITFNTAGLASATSPGLVGTGAQTFAGKKTLDGGALIKGDTSGVAIASGYVGERITTASTIVTTLATTSWSDVTNATITLTPGVWEIKAQGVFNYGTGAASGNSGYTQITITDNSNNQIGKTPKMTYAKTASNVSSIIYAPFSMSTIVNIVSNTTYKLRLKKTDTNGTGTGNIEVSAGEYEADFYAVRIA